MLYKFLIIITLIFSFNSHAQVPVITKIEPPNWWADYPYNNIEILIYGNNLDSVKAIIDYSNISIEQNRVSDNRNYLFLNLNIKNRAFPGNYNITLKNNYGETSFPFPILERDSSKNIHQGFSNEDVVYLIFPDRFSNGDTANDFLFNEKEEFEFGSLNGRHGGDIQGIINKLDYLDDLGITAIWVTPMLENNMYMSYHGYAATDLYKIDPRFGSSKLYKNLVEEAHKKGIKIIYDHVTNHIGVNHPWTLNPPTPTWLNGTVEHHKNAYHNKLAFIDIHGDSATVVKSQTGWFTDYMPDLNQKDKHLAKYIIQNTLWWIEFSGIDGIREDTYPYCDQKFMSVWAETILSIYPDFNIVGEIWKGEPSVLAKYQKNTLFPREFDSNLPVVTDFAFRDVLFDYLSGKNNLYNIYELFAQDFVYSNPDNLLVFFDNHDIDRGMYAAKWDVHKFKAALTLLLTTRGIPQLFYGTEFGLDGGGHHGKIRGEFPTGFMNTIPNAFTLDKEKKAKDIFNFTKSLLNLRKSYKALRVGKFLHFPPNDNIYIYKKSFEDEEILIIINDGNEIKKIDLSFYDGSEKKLPVYDLLNETIIDTRINYSLNIKDKSISILKLNY